MRRNVASLAAVLAALSFGGCGGGGAEPDAPGLGVADSGGRELELVLDFQPNAVHSGIYVAQQRGLFAERGVGLTIREPGASTDAPKLLQSGRADLAILDIHDLAIARESGLDGLVAVAPVVQAPLAAVIAGDRERIRTPADLAGMRIGVTGLPSDDAVLASVLRSAGLELDDVETVAIGFDAVAALSSGRVDAATAFWNAEGVALKRIGIPTREFRVDDFGAPTYPELVLVSTREALSRQRRVIGSALAAIAEGDAAVLADPGSALDDLLAAVPGLEREAQAAQLDAVLPLLPRGLEFDLASLRRWQRWDEAYGIVERAPDLGEAFADPGELIAAASEPGSGK